MDNNQYISYLLGLSKYAVYLVDGLNDDMDLDDTKSLIVYYDKREIDQLNRILTFNKSGNLCRLLMESIDKEKVIIQYIADMIGEFINQIPFNIKDNPKLSQLIIIACWVLAFEERVMSKAADYINDFDINLWLDLLLNKDSDLNRLTYLISSLNY